LGEKYASHETIGGDIAGRNVQYWVEEPARKRTKKTSGGQAKHLMGGLGRENHDLYTMAKNTEECTLGVLGKSESKALV